MTINFELRIDHKDKQGFCPLSLNFTHKGQRLRLNTEVSIPRIYYRRDYRHISSKVIDPSIKDKGINHMELIMKLQHCETKLKTIIDGWKREEDTERGIKEFPDKKYIKNLYYNKQVKGSEKPMVVHLLEYIYGKYDNIRLTYVGGKKGDIRRWNSIIRDVLEVRGHKINTRLYKNEKIKTWKDIVEDVLSKKDNKLIDFYLNDVDKDFLNSYVDVLLTRTYGKRVGLENVTIKKRIKSFKEFLTQMVEDNHKVNLDFQKFKLEKGTFKELDLETNIHILEMDEYKKLLKFDLSKIPRLEYVKDLYLITCGTGLRFSDVIRIEPKMIKTKKVDKKTIKYIRIDTQKTGKRVNPIITDHIDNILRKYKYDMKRSYRGGVHTISNDKGNQYLKEVLNLLELKSLDELDEVQRKSGKITSTTKGKRKDFITFHSGRKFFITNCILSGIPISLIMDWTGHSGSWDVFKNYIDTKYGGSTHLDKLPF